MAITKSIITLDRVSTVLKKSSKEAAEIILSNKDKYAEVTIEEAEKFLNKRAHTKDGKFKADDPSTPDVDEAYVGGKKPTKKTKSKKKK